MNRIIWVVTLVLSQVIFCYGQTEDYIKVNSTITELGIGYPRSFASETTYLDMFFNLGYQHSIGDKFFAGLYFAPQYRQNATGDLNISSKLRFGRLISKSENISIDFGYSIYSRSYKSLPGLALGFNYDKTNAYGLHVKYEEYNVDMPSFDKTLIFGIHFSGKNTISKGLPIIGTVLGVLAFYLKG